VQYQAKSFNQNLETPTISNIEIVSQYDLDNESLFSSNNISSSPKFKKRKVLIISYYFPPMGLSGVQRTLKFVKYLPAYD